MLAKVKGYFNKSREVLRAMNDSPFVGFMVSVGFMYSMVIASIIVPQMPYITAGLTFASLVGFAGMAWFSFRMAYVMLRGLIRNEPNPIFTGDRQAAAAAAA